MPSLLSQHWLWLSNLIRCTTCFRTRVPVSLPLNPGTPSTKSSTLASTFPRQMAISSMLSCVTTLFFAIHQWTFADSASSPSLFLSFSTILSSRSWGHLYSECVSNLCSKCECRWSLWGCSELSVFGNRVSRSTVRTRRQPILSQMKSINDYDDDNDNDIGDHMMTLTTSDSVFYIPR